MIITLAIFALILTALGDRIVGDAGPETMPVTALFGLMLTWLAPGALTRMTADLPRYIENPGMALGPDGIAPAVLYMVSELSGDQTGKVLGVSGPRGVREMRMMEKSGWKPPHAGWKAQDVVEHAKEIFFSEEEIKMGARRF